MGILVKTEELKALKTHIYPQNSRTSEGFLLITQGLKSQKNLERSHISVFKSSVYKFISCGEVLQ